MDINKLQIEAIKKDIHIKELLKQKLEILLMKKHVLKTASDKLEKEALITKEKMKASKKRIPGIVIPIPFFLIAYFVILVPYLKSNIDSYSESVQGTLYQLQHGYFLEDIATMALFGGLIFTGLITVVNIIYYLLKNARDEKVWEMYDYDKLIAELNPISMDIAEIEDILKG